MLKNQAGENQWLVMKRIKSKIKKEPR